MVSCIILQTFYVKARPEDTVNPGSRRRLDSLPKFLSFPLLVDASKDCIYLGKSCAKVKMSVCSSAHGFSPEKEPLQRLIPSSLLDWTGQ